MRDYPTVTYWEGRNEVDEFHRMPRSRIEGLLASFFELVDTGTQHTTIGTENVGSICLSTTCPFILALASLKGREG